MTSRKQTKSYPHDDRPLRIPRRLQPDVTGADPGKILAEEQPKGANTTERMPGGFLEQLTHEML